jgi:hypothetical protein
MAARSLAIVRTASAQQPRVLKILFYGQSISAPAWTDQAVTRLRATYPNVAFDVQNLALGGWSSALLERAALRDVTDFYPDLVVFHVYGDHRAYERIIRIIRSQTAADVIVQTDHVVTAVEPLCVEGISLHWSPPPGCTGHFRFKQRGWDDFMSGIWIPAMAQKYGLSVEPRRQRWDAYLKSHGLQPEALIGDSPHPNQQGWALMAELFTSWFDTLVNRVGTVAQPAPAHVSSFAAPRPGSTGKYLFEGNRFELLARGPLHGMIMATVDGKAPEALDGCWQDSRVSRLDNVPDWPALKRVSVQPAYHRANLWTIRVTGLNEPQGKFDFTVTGTEGGLDGSGSSTKTFKSPSGRITIEPEDWNLAYARQVSGIGVVEGASFTWARHFACDDQPAVSMANGEVEQRYTVATGLTNTRHVVELSVAPGAPDISEVRAYRPPLKP